ncbi:MAG: metallopeptidase TldD-related protein, partial [bacterium]|nr:metallopeptidase TldD-related protein [bacterium]
MRTIEELKNAVEAALEFLKTQSDIREAEVFVSSNANLLCRLNFTSHIPSNGVEESKSSESYGIGIQAVFSGPENKELIGFGSEPSDLSIEGVKQALAKARAAAIYDPEFVSLPLPLPIPRRLYDYADQKLMNVSDKDLVNLGWKIIFGALEEFEKSEELKRYYPSLKEAGLIIGGDVTVIQERMAIGSFHFPEIRTDESTLIMAAITAMIEAGNSKGSACFCGTRLNNFSDEAGREAARNAIAGINGARVPSGKYKVVFGGQAMDDLLKLLVGSLSLDAFYMGETAFEGKFGQKIVSEKLTIYDNGSEAGCMGSKGITCEGLPTGRTDLIRYGILVGVLANWYEAQRMLNHPEVKKKLGINPKKLGGTLPPRNGFRFATGGGRSFENTPGIAPTNVFVESGEAKPLEELLKEVGDGIYIGRIWYTYPVNGMKRADFTCTVVADSFLIKDGKLAEPLKPNTVRINDNFVRVFNDVIGVSDKAKGVITWAADEVTYSPEVAVSDVQI